MFESKEPTCQIETKRGDGAFSHHFWLRSAGSTAFFVIFAITRWKKQSEESPTSPAPDEGELFSHAYLAKPTNLESAPPPLESIAANDSPHPPPSYVEAVAA